MGGAEKQGGIMGATKKYALMTAATATFMRLYTLPVKDNSIPDQSRLQPAW